MDLQFAAKECARKMSKPTVGDWGRLQRIGRYLRGHMRCIIEYNFQQIPEYLTSYSDANWALDTETRKSTSGGIITFGKHYIKSWFKISAIVALSSAESELYGLVKCVSETLGVKSALFDFGILGHYPEARTRGTSTHRHIVLVLPADQCGQSISIRKDICRFEPKRYLNQAPRRSQDHEVHRAHEHGVY